MQKTTLSVRELAEQLGISLPKAYELVRQPGFPVMRIGGRILIPADSLQCWIRNQVQTETEGGSET